MTQSTMLVIDVVSFDFENSYNFTSRRVELEVCTESFKEHAVAINECVHEVMDSKVTGTRRSFWHKNKRYTVVHMDYDFSHNEEMFYIQLARKSGNLSDRELCYMTNVVARAFVEDYYYTCRVGVPMGNEVNFNIIVSEDSPHYKPVQDYPLLENSLP